MKTLRIHHVHLRHRFTVFCGLLVFAINVAAFATTPSLENLNKTKNILIPDWGPFSKDFAGVSHVIGEGARFDLSLMAAPAGKKPRAPDVLTAAGFNPWEASADYCYHSYRMELDGGSLAAIVSFVPFGGDNANARLMRVELTNSQSRPRRVDLLPVMRLVPEPTGAKSPSLTEPPPGIRIKAEKYSKIEYAKPPPDSHLAKDGLCPGELAGFEWIGSRAFGKKWGENTGDCVRYDIECAESITDAVAWIRYRNASQSAAHLQAVGIADAVIVLPPAKEPTNIIVPLGKLAECKRQLTLTVIEGAQIALDEIIILEKAEADRISLKPTPRNDKPFVKQLGASGVMMHYPERNITYGFSWDGAASQPRQISGAKVATLFERPMTPSEKSRFESRGLLSDASKANYVVSEQTVEVPSNGTTILYALICTGDESTVAATLDTFSHGGDLETAWRTERNRSMRSQTILPAAKPYQRGERLMTATTLMNIVYPECIDGEWIKHYTPGKRWNSLYTWDSGFIGIGLASIAPERATENLNTYVNNPEHHSAFIHHGTPLPIQMYQFMEIWNRNPDPELLRYFYPRLKRFYQFYAGRAEGSTTAKLKSGLLRTWDYFYNSGGWDDYPPQKYLIGNKPLRERTTPVVSTATALRMAKTLRTLAALSGNKADIAAYDRDIATFADALQAHAWDAEIGYYSYVTHDADGRPIGILRHESGANFNQGLDGLYPLITGICTPEQRAKLIGHLFDPKRIWTPYGISTVDRTAPYYSPDGYWNGAVWFPHQWVFWKALLDMGESELAFRIASTGLENWRRLTGATNNCYEHINIKDGKGDGCPHFSGLSAPVLNWFDAYYRIGSITGGFDMVVTKREFSETNNALVAEISFGPPLETPRTIIVTLIPGRDYEARWNGEVIPVSSPHAGCLWLQIPGTSTNGRLEIR